MLIQMLIDQPQMLGTILNRTRLPRNLSMPEYRKENPMNAYDLDDRDLDRLARKRAAAKMGWFIHALVYVCVNLLLAVLSGMTDGGWAVFPALGWGIGLGVHGLVTFLVTGGAGLHEHLVQQERRRLTLQRDPW